MGFRVAAAVAWCGLAIAAGPGCGGGGAAPAPSQQVPTTPAVPAGLTASAGDGTVTLGWQLVDGSTGYVLYWTNAPGVTKATGARISGVTSPYVHGPLANGTTYHYVVTAVGPGGESAESEERSATPGADAPPCSVPGPPAAVASASCSASGVPQFTVAWPAVAGATSYDLYWGTQADGLRESGTRAPNVSSPYVHGGLSKDSPYFYVVTASNACGEGEPSAAVGGRTPADPAAPASLQLRCTPHVGPSWTFELSWAPVPFASSYDVFAMRVIYTGEAELVGATDATSTAVTVNDCTQYTVAIPGAHWQYVSLGVSASACAPGVPCTSRSPVSYAGPVPRCVDTPTILGWSKETRTLRWAPTAGASSYWVGASTCAGFEVQPASCAAAECTAVLPESCIGSPSATVSVFACSAMIALSSEPFPLDW